MVALLARHAEDIQKTCDQRRSMVVAVRRQEEEMRAAIVRRLSAPWREGTIVGPPGGGRTKRGDR